MYSAMEVQEVLKGNKSLEYEEHSGQPVQSLSHVRLFVTSWTTARPAPLSSTISWSLLKFTSIESVMVYNHLILCRPPLLLPSIFPSTRVFSNESALHMRWPKYWSFSFNISLSNEHSELISFRMDWLDLLQSKGLSGVFSSTTVQKQQFFGTQPPSQSSSYSITNMHILVLVNMCVYLHV